jgi:hypothetical protein
LDELNLKDLKCLNAIFGQTEYDNQTVYRYLCTKSDTKIHIIRIFYRNDFYIMKKLSSTSVDSGNYFRDESHFESAFDEFELRQCISDNIMWYFPKQLIKILTQTKNSRFIEYDKKLANYSIGSDRRKFKHSKEELELTTVVKINQNVKRVNFRFSYSPLRPRMNLSRKERPRDRPGFGCHLIYC